MGLVILCVACYYVGLEAEKEEEEENKKKKGNKKKGK